MKMAPSFMSANLLDIRGELAACDAYADYYHVDIIDWHYVKNMCLTPQIIKAMSSATSIPIEAHLYVDNIDLDIIELCLNSGARLITVPADVVGRQIHRIATTVHNGGAKLGVFLNPAQAIEEVEPYAQLIDSLLIMSVDPGFGGQTFLPNTFERIARAKALRIESGASYQIAVDGNCDDDKFVPLIKAGADAVSLGRAVFARDPDTAKAAQLTRAALDRAKEMACSRE